MTASRYEAFAVAAPGLETFVAAELATVDGDARVTDGGVAFRATLPALYQAATALRTPESVHVRIGRARATNFDELRDAIQRVPWHAWLWRQPEIRVTAAKSRLFHTEAIRERAAAAVAACIAGRASAEGRDAHCLVHIRLHHDVCVTSIDATGETAHLRGIRRHVVEGGIRETLAAACICAADLRTLPAVWDPFCGAGTLGLEWLATALDLPVFGDRALAIEAFPIAASTLHAARWSATVAADAAAAAPVRWYGSDRAERAIEATRRNVADAGLAAAVWLTPGDFDEVEKQIPSGTAVFSNLPYGKRVRGGVDDSLRRLGELLRRRKDLRPAVFVHAHPDLDARLRLPLRRLAQFNNRGLRVSLSVVSS